MANFSIVFPDALLLQLNAKAHETGMSGSELVRIATASFLAQENALTAYLDAIDTLDKKLVLLVTRQELFGRALGNAILVKDASKSPELNQKFSDRINQIIDTTGDK